MPSPSESPDLSTDITERDTDPVREQEAYAELVDRQIREEMLSFAAQLRQEARRLEIEMLATGNILFGVHDQYDQAASECKRGAEVLENAALADEPLEYLKNYFREQRERQDRERSRRDANANRWFSVALGLKFGGLVSIPILIPLLIDLFARRASDQPSSDIQFFPDDPDRDRQTKVMLFEHHDAWLNQSDHDYWTTTMAPIAMSEIPTSGQRPTLGDHLFYMNFTKAISRLEEPFFWDSGDDYMGIVNQLVAEFDLKAPTHIADLYLKLPLIRYRDQPLPRAVAADLMQSTLAMIAKANS